MRKDTDTNLPLQAVYLKAAGELVSRGQLIISRVVVPGDDNGEWLLSMGEGSAVVEFNPFPYVSAAIEREVHNHRREIERHNVQLESLKNQLPDIEAAEAHIAFLQSQVDSYKVPKGDSVAQGQLDALKRTLREETVRLGDIAKWRGDVEAGIKSKESEIASLDASIKEAKSTKLAERQVYEFKF